MAWGRKRMRGKGYFGPTRRARGPVVVSGYPSPLYAELYEAHGWRRYERPFVTNSGGKRVEAVWVNWEG